jgi:hypothetical protein
MTRIFLAHAEEDEKAVIDLYEQLKEEGYDPWIYQKDSLPGQIWQSEVPKTIKNCDFFIACFSDISNTKDGWFQREIKIALNELANKPPGKIYFIPLRLNECNIPENRQNESGTNLSEIHAVDLFSFDGFDRLLKALESNSSDTDESIYSQPDPYDAESYYIDGDGFGFFDLLKWGFGVLLLLGGIGTIANGGGTYGPSQPGGIVRSQRIVVTPRTGNCQPLRIEPTDESDLIGCVYAGTELTAISDELQNGWIRVQGSANGSGWMYYLGLSAVPSGQ